MARVCMVAFSYYSMDARVRREAETLAARGDEVDVVGLREDGQSTRTTLHGVQVLSTHIRAYQGHKKLLYMLRYLEFFVAAFLRISLYNLVRRYDVVQVHTMPDFLVFTALIPKLMGARVIIDVHDLMPELFMTKFALGRRSPLVRLVTAVERLSVLFADRAIAVSLPHLDALLSHGNPRYKFSVLMNLPDPRIFVPRPFRERLQNGHFRLLYHGTVARRNGLHVAIKAIDIARNSVPGLELTIIGIGEELPELVQMVTKLGLEASVWLSKCGVPLEQIPTFMDRCDVGVVPIVNDEFTRHTLPTKLLEYIVRGLPVISSRLESLERYFDDTKLCYFGSGDPAELADCIVRLYRSPKTCAQMVTKANTFFDQYSWDRACSLYYNLIDSLCCKSSRDRQKCSRVSSSSSRQRHPAVSFRQKLRSGFQELLCRFTRHSTGNR